MLQFSKRAQDALASTPCTSLGTNVMAVGSSSQTAMGQLHRRRGQRCKADDTIHSHPLAARCQSSPWRLEHLNSKAYKATIHRSHINGDHGKKSAKVRSQQRTGAKLWSQNLVGDLSQRHSTALSCSLGQSMLEAGATIAQMNVCPTKTLCYKFSKMISNLGKACASGTLATSAAGT